MVVGQTEAPRGPYHDERKRCCKPSQDEINVWSGSEPKEYKIRVTSPKAKGMDWAHPGYINPKKTLNKVDGTSGRVYGPRRRCSLHDLQRLRYHRQQEQHISLLQITSSRRLHIIRQVTLPSYVMSTIPQYTHELPARLSTPRPRWVLDFTTTFPNNFYGWGLASLSVYWST